MYIILYPTNLLNSSVSSSIFFLVSLGFLCIVPCHLQAVTVLLLPFQFCSFFSLIFLVWFPCLRLPILYWIKKVTRVGILVLFLILEEMLSAFTIKYDVAVDLSYMAFIMLSYVPSISTLLRVFIINNCSILSNAISVEMIIWFYSSVNMDTTERLNWTELNMVYHIDCFVAFESFLHPWDKCHSVMLCDTFNVLFNLAC